MFEDDKKLIGFAKLSATYQPNITSQSLGNKWFIINTLADEINGLYNFKKLSWRPKARDILVITTTLLMTCTVTIPIYSSNDLYGKQLYMNNILIVMLRIDQRAFMQLTLTSHFERCYKCVVKKWGCCWTHACWWMKTLLHM